MRASLLGSLLLVACAHLPLRQGVAIEHVDEVTTAWSRVTPPTLKQAGSTRAVVGFRAGNAPVADPAGAYWATTSRGAGVLALATDEGNREGLGSTQQRPFRQLLRTSQGRALGLPASTELALVDLDVVDTEPLVVAGVKPVPTKRPVSEWVDAALAMASRFELARNITDLPPVDWPNVPQPVQFNRCQDFESFQSAAWSDEAQAVVVTRLWRNVCIHHFTGSTHGFTSGGERGVEPMERGVHVSFERGVTIEVNLDGEVARFVVHTPRPTAGVVE